MRTGIYLIIVFVFISLNLYAPPTNPAPIGGVSYLLIAGIVLGVFALNKRKKQ